MSALRMRALLADDAPPVAPTPVAGSRVQIPTRGRSQRSTWNTAARCAGSAARRPMRRRSASSTRTAPRGLPVIRFGRTLRVPTAALLELLGLTDTQRNRATATTAWCRSCSAWRADEQISNEKPATAIAVTGSTHEPWKGVLVSNISQGFEWDRFKSDVWSASKVGDDTIEGTVIGVDVKDGRSGPVPVVTFQLADGSTKQVWAGAVDLRQKLADIAPQIGDYLRIEFVDERATGQPSKMKIFDVTMPRRPDVDGDASDEPF